MIIVRQAYVFKELNLAMNFSGIVPTNWEVRPIDENIAEFFTVIDPTHIQAQFITTIPLYMNVEGARGLIDGEVVEENQLLPPGTHTFIGTLQYVDAVAGSVYNVSFHKIPVNGIDENIPEWPVYISTGGSAGNTFDAQPDNVIVGGAGTVTQIDQAGEYIPLEAYDENGNTWKAQDNGFVENADNTLFTKLVELSKTSAETEFPQRFFTTGSYTLANLDGTEPRCYGIVKNPE